MLSKTEVHEVGISRVLTLQKGSSSTVQKHCAGKKNRETSIVILNEGIFIMTFGHPVILNK